MANPNKTEPQIVLLLETGGGGSGRHVLDLYKGLTARGWPTRLWVSLERADAGFLDELKQLDPDAVVKLPMRRSPHVTDLSALNTMHGLLADSSTRHLIHAHSTKAGLLGAMVARWSAATVFTPHAYRGMDATLGWGSRTFIRQVEAAFSQAYDKIIAVSPEEVRYTESLGVPTDRIRYIPNGVDFEALLSRLPARTKTAGRHTIGFIGRMVYQKNPLLFLQVLAMLVERGLPVTGVIVGDGPLRGEMVEATERLGLAGLVEWREPTAAIKALADMDVVMHTSRYESFPYTLLEAAASLTPIVAVQNAGSEVILRDAHAMAVVSDGSAAGLANAVEELLCNEVSRSAYIGRLHEIRGRYTVDKMVVGVAEAYDELLRAT